MRTFRERLDEDAFPITYEALSPRGVDVEPFLQTMREFPLLDRLAAINLTNNPSARIRVDPAAYGHLLKDATGVDIIPHLTIRDDTLAGIQRWLFGAWVLGLRNVSVMTGDHPREGDYPDERRVDSLNSLELIAGIKRFLAHGHLIPDVVGVGAARYANRLDPPKPPKSVSAVDFFVGAPLIPWRNNELQYARAKVAAGVDFFQTQITWDAEPVLDFIQQAEERDLLQGAPILVGVAPLKTLKTMEFMHGKIPHVKVPKDVQERLKAAKDPGWESVEACVETLERLRDGHRDRGLHTKIGGHVLPINDDRLGAEIVRRIQHF